MSEALNERDQLRKKKTFPEQTFGRMSSRVMLESPEHVAKGRIERHKHQVRFIIKLGLNRLRRVYASFDVTSHNISAGKSLCVFVREKEKPIISRQLGTVPRLSKENPFPRFIRFRLHLILVRLV